MRNLLTATSLMIALGISQPAVAQSVNETADYIVYGVANNSVIYFKGTNFRFSKAREGDGDLSAQVGNSQISIGAIGGGCKMEIRWSYNDYRSDKDDISFFTTIDFSKIDKAEVTNDSSSITGKTAHFDGAETKCVSHFGDSTTKFVPCSTAAPFFGTQERLTKALTFMQSQYCKPNAF